MARPIKTFVCQTCGKEFESTGTRCFFCPEHSRTLKRIAAMSEEKLAAYNERRRLWTQNHMENLRAYQHAHVEELREARRAYFLSHREEINAKRRERYATRKAQEHEKDAARYEDRKEQLLEAQRKRRERKKLRAEQAAMQGAPKPKPASKPRPKKTAKPAPTPATKILTADEIRAMLRARISR